MYIQLFNIWLNVEIIMKSRFLVFRSSIAFCKWSFFHHHEDFSCRSSSARIFLIRSQYSAPWLQFRRISLLVFQSNDRFNNIGAIISIFNATIPVFFFMTYSKYMPLYSMSQKYAVIVQVVLLKIMEFNLVKH